MNNKGFTMIELIMVIMIIALLALLSAPNIIKMINRNKRENYNDTIDSIIETAELYASDNRYSLNFNDNCGGESTKEIQSIITLQQLVDGKYLSSTIKNHCTDDNLKDVSVKVILSCSNNSFKSFSISGGIIIKDGITDGNGKLIEGKFCDDLTK